MHRRQENRRAAFVSDQSPGEIVAAGYLELLRLGGRAFADAFEQIVSPGGTPVLVHCAAGKDRTGVLVALLLDVAQVDHDTIVADYAATNERMAPIVHRLGGAASYAQVDDKYPKFVFEAVAETMVRFLEHVDEEWHGAAGFLSAMGVVDEHLARWRGLFVA